MRKKQQVRVDPRKTAALLASTRDSEKVKEILLNEEMVLFPFPNELPNTTGCIPLADLYMSEHRFYKNRRKESRMWDAHKVSPAAR